MSFAIKTQDEVWEGADFGYTLGQVAGADGVLVVQADVSVIDLYIYQLDVSDETPIQSFTALSPSNAPARIIDTPSTDKGWTEDGIGHNFQDYLSLTALNFTPKGGKTYRLKYIIHTDTFDGQPGNWGPLVGVRDVTVRGLGGS